MYNMKTTQTTDAMGKTLEQARDEARALAERPESQGYGRSVVLCRWFYDYNPCARKWTYGVVWLRDGEQPNNDGRRVEEVERFRTAA